MKYLLAAIVLATAAQADHTDNRVVAGKQLLSAGPCTEVSTGRSGFCEVYEGGFLAFWTDANTIAWVKDKDGNIVYMDGEVDA